LKKKLFILFSLFFFSCQEISNNSNNLIARAGENFLFQDDLPKFNSEEDSTKRYLNFIESWAKENILYDLSLTNLSQSKKNEIDKLVEKFRIDLYINSYKDLIINSRIDSIVDQTDIESYYESNINNFSLNENLIKYRYLKLPSDNLNLSRIRRNFIRMNDDDRVFLDSLNFQFADTKLNDTLWITEREVISSLEFLNQSNKSNYFRTNRLFVINSDEYVEYFYVKDLLKSGNIPPLSYLYERIRSIIINQRKIELLQNINNEILKDAIKSNKYEVFK
jgi:hypothetical protein